MEQKNNKILAIAGPTASGKTGLAVALARRLGGEVISSDSMQLYRGMEIGTAAPTPEEMGGVPHHMIGVVPPEAEYSCAQYAADATAIADRLLADGVLPVFCGGTGLYLDAVLYGDGLSDAGADPAVRQRLEAFYQAEGADALHARLAAVDPEAAAAIHKNNVRRVIRALEIYETTGMPKSQFDGLSAARASRYDCTLVVLTFASRELLYGRIEARVDQMMAAGLLREAESLYQAGLLAGTSAGQAIGYKEFLPYFAGECSLADAVDAIKQNTRRYAKRQITWWKRYPDAISVCVDNAGAMRDRTALVEEILLRIKGDSGQNHPGRNIDKLR